MPYFDQPLSNIALNASFVVPSFLEDCFEFVIEHADVEGIFRVPGNDTEVKRLISIIDATGNVEIHPNTYVFNICNVISRFIKRIPEHLLIDKNVSQWKGDLTLEQVQKKINDLPVLNRAFLSRIFAFFITIASHSKSNLMGVSNLSKILSAVLIEDKKDPYWLLKPEVVAYFFTDYHKIFNSMPGLTSDGQFMTKDEFQNSVGDIFNAFFCQSYANHKPEISAVKQEKQKKMCRIIETSKVTWDEMFTILLHPDPNRLNDNSDAHLTPIS
ncbi:RhoGAP domain containing protein [Tritrichomonas foetus]|uniref:RhoGAP domain containing protein n=1 Tax=Tritrichomonas foetus TaxID=1144522 RepID=A0A1J4K3E7_9EUKA|nr:RhoGAP domain containing protein [Tritrichomonas foetus]|eukprot:OHT04268.1 RhoGAP domain containing protein [Tritrichomonas foetus]